MNEHEMLVAENQALKAQVAALQGAENSWQSGYNIGHRMGEKRMQDEVAHLKRLLGQAFVDATAWDGKPERNGSLLPPIGSRVLFHLSSSDAWTEFVVTSYYAWGDHGGDPVLHRVFVYGIDAQGFSNSRMLKDVRPAVSVEA